jgi:hypothetical protein
MGCELVKPGDALILKSGHVSIALHAEVWGLREAGLGQSTPEETSGS